MILIHQSKSFPPVIVSYACSRQTITCKNEAYSTCNRYICVANNGGIQEAEFYPWGLCLAAFTGWFVLRALLH